MSGAGSGRGRSGSDGGSSGRRAHGNRDERAGGSRSGREGGRPDRGRPRGGERQRTASAPSERRRSGDPARLVAFDVLREVDGSDAYANLVLPPLLRERRITGRDAGFATELAYGTLRMRGRYDAIIEQCSQRELTAIEPAVLDILRLGIHQLLAMRVPPHAAVSETVGLARQRTGAGSGQFVNAVLRRASEHSLDEWLELIAAAADPAGTDTEARLAVVESHPGWIVRGLRGALVANGRDARELEGLLAAQNEAPRVTLVARPGITDQADLPDDAIPGRWAPTAHVLPAGDPGALRAVREGRVGVQDEGSQLVALALAAAPLDGTDARWLDLCAGPGGKSALLGALAAQRGGHLVANEVAAHRAELVRRAVVGLPEGTVEVRHGDGRELGAFEPGQYDRVLVDAPCTGLGALRRRPESRWRRQPADLAGLGPLQRELLTSALDAVRPGGLVAFVTCSPHIAETHLVVEDVLRGRQDVEVVDASAVVHGIAPEIPLAERADVQLWPHVHGTDAMFLALLRRRA
ncbi:MAG: rRNA small subunit methyltransferase B [Actinomycetales bacterium]|nr:rRNA small subunit methyltransferase B [Actinomycetales bacterium]